MSKVALIGCSNYELYEVKKLFGEVFLILVELKVYFVIKTEYFYSQTSGYKN